jgi:beta-phosphoglucomutase-like phosphatase (HAD superfamily)/choline kinase
MNIIIPLGGVGKRFRKYSDKPKALIDVNGMPMIEFLLKNLNISNNDFLIFIYNKELDKYNFKELIKNIRNTAILKETPDTLGAAHTILNGLKDINFDSINKKTLLLDCDTIYTVDICDDFRKQTHNTVYYSKNYDINSIYSYIDMDDHDCILKICEKIKISDNANTGAYGFSDISDLYKYCQIVMDKNIRFKNEFYTSCVISEMIKDNYKFYGKELNSDTVISLGTPELLERYLEKRICFLFDLDGTLVYTDNVYFHVWEIILSRYNICLTKEIYTKYILGNNDKFVCQNLLMNINVSLSELSEIKDELFIKFIEKITIIPGVSEIFDLIKKKGHCISVVTNCNYITAKEILTYLNLGKYIDYLITSNDCVNGKPDTEPYLKVIQKYKVPSNKCIIFEDSKSGLQSAKGVNPKQLVGVETIFSKKELLKFCVDHSLKNYIDFDIDKLLSNNKTLCHFKKYIKNNIYVSDVKEIHIEENNNKLQGGFIAQVFKFSVQVNDSCVANKNMVCKYENKNASALCEMAYQLDLYEREYYYYENIHRLNVLRGAEFYGVIKDSDEKNIGLLLEDLKEKGFALNLDLNKTTIDTSLLIVDRMSKMHIRFWNKNLCKRFPQLKKSTSNTFYPFFKNYIDSKKEIFIDKWKNILNENQIALLKNIITDFSKIQESFSVGENLTFIHGDIKSPNIFYDLDNNNEPYFIDYQHCGIGKGVQDLVFFIIESFDINNIDVNFTILNNYYYKKIVEGGINTYTLEEYNNDLYNAVCYIPIFTSVWFGSMNQSELIDKNFPYFFIKKTFYLLEKLSRKK